MRYVAVLIVAVHVQGHGGCIEELVCGQCAAKILRVSLRATHMLISHTTNRKECPARNDQLHKQVHHNSENSQIRPGIPSRVTHAAYTRGIGPEIGKNERDLDESDAGGLKSCRRYLAPPVSKHVIAEDHNDKRRIRQ